MPALRSKHRLESAPWKGPLAVRFLDVDARHENRRRFQVAGLHQIDDFLERVQQRHALRLAQFPHARRNSSCSGGGSESRRCRPDGVTCRYILRRSLDPRSRRM